jgi:hypothetical protein
LDKRALGQGQQMSQQFQSSRIWRGGRSEALWLSTLVDTMEQVSQAPRRVAPCDSNMLAALRAQLALPAPRAFASSLSLRN